MQLNHVKNIIKLINIQILKVTTNGISNTKREKKLNKKIEIKTIARHRFELNPYWVLKY